MIKEGREGRSVWRRREAGRGGEESRGEEGLGWWRWCWEEESEGN